MRNPEGVDLRQYSATLTRNADGIWVGNVGATVSYPTCGNEACLQVEDGSFWFRHRNRCIVAAAHRYLADVKGPIFDVGGGNGYVAKGFREAGFEVVLVEPGLDGARNARRRGLPHVVCATTDGCGFGARSVPAIGLFDVVEHVADDKAFLGSIVSLLVERGYLLLTVPAHAALWSAEDEFAGHFRRYTRGAISGLLQRLGLSIVFASYFFRPLPLPILLMRALPFRLGFGRRAKYGNAWVSHHAVDAGFLSRALEHVLAGEVDMISRGQSMSFGASVLVVARSKS